MVARAGGRGGDDITSLLVVLRQAELLQCMIDVAASAIDSAQGAVVGCAMPGIVSEVLVELKLGGRVKLLPGQMDLSDLVERRILPGHQG